MVFKRFFTIKSLFLLGLVFPGIVLPLASTAQLRGKVIYKKNSEPANLATVKLVSATSSSIYLTDRFGNFVFSQKGCGKGRQRDHNGGWIPRHSNAAGKGFKNKRV